MKKKSLINVDYFYLNETITQEIYFKANCWIKSDENLKNVNNIHWLIR